MTGERIIVGQETSKPRREPLQDFSKAVRAVSLLCLMFVGVGLVDVTLALYSLRFESPVTRFAVFGSISGGLPILAMGLAGFQILALISAGDRRIRIGGLLNALALIGVATALGIFVSSIAPAFAGAPRDSLPSLRQTVARSLAFYILFGAAFAVAAWTGLRPGRGKDGA